MDLADLANRHFASLSIGVEILFAPPLLVAWKGVRE